jgi:hypothetical protein
MQSHPDFFEALFKRDISSPEINTFLQQTADKYPFFAPAQFYLLTQTETEVATYNHQAAKTAILFNNDYWLNFQLEQSLKVNHLKARQEPIPVLIKEETVQAPLIETKNLEPLLFQPLFATDYFASQGIKLSEEVQSTDRLSEQLKSFTEWLRTMKKLHAEKMPQVDYQTDERIQKLAEQSNNEQEIVTEAMAEVLVQQGLIQKAIEVYEKLSLLSPAKSVYFAAKIKQLNEQ